MKPFCAGLTFPILALAASLSFAAEAGAPLPKKPPTPEVWLCCGGISQLVKQENPQWDYVRTHLDGVKLYVGTARHMPMDDLKPLLSLFKKNNIQLAIECAGTQGFLPKNEDLGRRSADIDLGTFDRIYEAGGSIDFLDMDGPVSRTIFSGRHRYESGGKFVGFKTIGPSVNQVIEYMCAVNKKYPKIRFFDLTNFPNWGWKGDVSYHARDENSQDHGDFYNVVSMLLPKARKAKTRLAGVTVDNPYSYAVGQHKSVKLPDPSKVDWIARVRDLEDYVESQGCDFNLIVNTDIPENSPDAEKRYCEETLKMIDLYHKAGGSPKRYIVQSWSKIPRNVLPETEPYTMTWLVKEVIQRVKEAPG